MRSILLRGSAKRPYPRFVAAPSSRLARRIRLDFPGSDDALALVEQLDVDERVQAAVVLWASGDSARLADAAALVQLDWRDALVRAGLADDDWVERLDAALGLRE